VWSRASWWLYELGQGSNANLWLHGADVLLSKFLQATAGFSPPPWGSRYRDPLDWPLEPVVGDFFFDNIFEITLYLLPCLSCVACFNFNQSSISWSLLVCTRTGHVHFVPSLCFNLVLLRLHIYSCNHLLNAQYLAVCNLCLAWISNELYLD
jgi:hypothetical protein